MLGKLALVLGFVVLLVVAARLSGAPLIPRGEEPSAADRPSSVNPEAERIEWLDHVTAICDWERMQAKALARVYRKGGIGAPKDVELMLLAVIRMSDESKAIFDRLRGKWLGIVVNILAFGVRDGSFRADLDPAVAGAMIIATLTGATRIPGTTAGLIRSICVELERSVRNPKIET